MHEDPLVEAFVAGREQRQALLAGEAFDNLLVERPPLRRQHDDPVVGLAAVDGVERRGGHVHPQHHPRATAVRLVVDLTGAKRCEVPVVEQPQLELSAEHGGERTLLREPCEGVWNEGEDVELHSGKVLVVAGEAARYTILPAARSTSLMQSSCIGSARPESSSSTSFATPGATSATRPSARPPSSSTWSPTSSKT